MFADDTNLFYSHSNIKTLFKTVNEELNKLSEWFACNKLSEHRQNQIHIFSQTMSKWQHSTLASQAYH